MSFHRSEEDGKKYGIVKYKFENHFINGKIKYVYDHDQAWFN